MIPTALLVAAMVVLNSSADVRVPLQVTVGGQSSAGSGTAQAAPVALDATTISGMIALAGGFFYRMKQGQTREKVSAQTTMLQAESLKQTDKGVQDLTCALSRVVDMIPGVPDAAKQLINNEMNAWISDNVKYYENNPAKPTDLSKDPIVKKLGEVQKISEKSD